MISVLAELGRRFGQRQPAWISDTALRIHDGDELPPRTGPSSGSSAHVDVALKWRTPVPLSAPP
jgi:hypothetical protein